MAVLGDVFDWEQKKLEDIVIVKDGTHDSPEYIDNGYPLITSKNLKKGNIDFSEVSYISKQNYEKINKRSKVEINDIIFAMIGTIGNPVIVKSNKFAIKNVALLKKSSKINSIFLCEILKSDIFKKYINKVYSGNTQKFISLNQIKSFNLQVTDIKEEDQIANILEKFSSLEATQQRKLDQLKLLKKGLLQKMFADEKSKVPEIRFKGFDGEWEQKKLFNCLREIIDFRGKTPKKLGLTWNNEDIGYLALSAINVKNGYIDFDVPTHWGNIELYNKWMVNHELHKNQVLMTTEAPMGNVAQIPDNKKYILSQRVIGFDIKKEILDENYLADVLITSTIQNKLKSVSSGGTAKGISQKSLSTININIPNIFEQRDISLGLKIISTIISTQQRKLNQLQQVKKFLLQNMFI